MKLAERDKIMVLNEQDKKFAASIGFPEEELLKLKQEAYDNGDIDEDGNPTSQPVGVKEMFAKLRELATEEPEGCDGDCEHCHLHDEEFEFSNEEIENVVDKYYSNVTQIFIAQADAAWEIIKGQSLTIPEEDRPVFIAALKNALMSTLGIVDRNISDHILEVTGKK